MRRAMCRSHSALTAFLAAVLRAPLGTAASQSGKWGNHLIPLTGVSTPQRTPAQASKTVWVSYGSEMKVCACDEVQVCVVGAKG